MLLIINRNNNRSQPFYISDISIGSNMFKRKTPNIGDTPGVDVYLPITCVLFPEMSRFNHFIYIYYGCKQALILLPCRTDRGQISAQIHARCHAYQCGSTDNKLPMAKTLTIQKTKEMIYMFTTFLMSILSALLNLVSKKSIIFLFPFPQSVSF